MQERSTEARDAARPSLRFVTPSAEAVAAPTPTEGHDLSKARYIAGLVAVVGLAFLLRLSLILRSDFPLNDGALFYQMVVDLQQNGYGIPAFTTFNDANIPFGYPPLTFYLAGFLTDATPVSLIETFRWLPLVGSMLIVLAFVALAASMLKSRVTILSAALLFAMLGPTFMWMVMGGGLTRSFGFAFAIAAIWQTREMYMGKTYWRVPIVAVLASCAITSHLEMGWFAAFSCALFFVAEGRHRAGIICTALIVLVVPALTSPWWFTVFAEHGPEPFVAALDSGVNPFTGPLLLLQYNIAVEPLFPINAALGLLGVVVCLARRQYVLPVWLLLIAVLDPRGFPTSATVPLALLAAIGLTDVVLPFAGRADSTGAAPQPAARMAPVALATTVASLVVLYAILSAVITTPKLLTGLTPEEREAMAWAGANTPEESRFAIVTNDGWAVDRTSEWFPLLSGRTSVATVQGSEWISGRYSGSQKEYNDLQDCALENGDCLFEWSRTTGIPLDYVYIPHLVPRVPLEEDDVCCISLQLALKTDPRFVRMYEGPGATIYQVAAVAEAVRRGAD